MILVGVRAPATLQQKTNIRIADSNAWVDSRCGSGDLTSRRATDSQ